MRHTILLLAALALLSGCGNSAQQKAEAERKAMFERYHQREAEESARPKRITYRVLGTGGEASVTYENGIGGTDQKNITTPWDYTFAAGSGAFLYCSAQTDKYGRHITTQILVDGKVNWRAETDEEFGIASASGRL